MSFSDKKYMILRIFYSLVVVLLVGCGPQLENFVNSGAKHPIITTPIIDPPSFSTASSKAIKYSPGATTTTGSQADAKFSLTPTRFATTGSQADTVLSINRSRVQ